MKTISIVFFIIFATVIGKEDISYNLGRQTIQSKIRILLASQDPDIIKKIVTLYVQRQSRIENPGLIENPRFFKEIIQPIIKELLGNKKPQPLEDQKEFDRGYTFLNPFLATVLPLITDLIDKNPSKKITCYDFGSGENKMAALFSLLGAHSIGIELYPSEADKERAKRCALIACAASLIMHPEDSFSCQYKQNSVLFLDDKEFPNDSAHFIWAASFLHMFNSKDAKTCVDQAYRLLQKGGFFCATVDGLDIENPSQTLPIIQSPRKAYKIATSRTVRYPNILKQITFGTTEQNGKKIQFTGKSIVYNYVPNAINSDGSTTNPMRTKTIYKLDKAVIDHIKKEWGITGVTHILEQLVAFADEDYVRSLFPETQWNLIMVNPSPNAHSVLCWQVIAQKK